ncbi:MAG: hypothetical protein K8F92_13300 [Hyphomicrobium sp.]|uniref:hypothetical protein n=1 Tax=Hyphomicrobium sp. TaxID=82 RepID=UPI001326D451|nr:hypothetical protein [Hyphomicrobium sp.]KAB2943680.1 MAG: hypothetical protein F9K20_03235 [Hyphomicrobium sp.]MBZ0210617.1 hypothetical protein [Hyphomicrobium sp.]
MLRISTALLLLALGGAQSRAAPLTHELFVSMSGYWSGPGRIHYDGGVAEALSCKAYYTTKNQIDRLSIVLRCASPSNKIELRAQLVAQGENLSGSWEERTFNASGTVTGRVSEGQVSLSIDGGGFSAAMLVTQETSNQSVSITTQGVGFNEVSVSLTRKGGERNYGRDNYGMRDDGGGPEN